MRKFKDSIIVTESKVCFWIHDDEDDLAGHNCIRLLKYLRVVLHQDLAVLQPGFLELPLFTHPLVWQPEWQAFASTVRLHHEND